MPLRPHLVAFDLDDTLAPSKSPMPAPMAAVFLELLPLVEVCVISGGHFPQFSHQLLRAIAAAPAHDLDRLHLMPTCGTQYYRHTDGNWDQLYAYNLTEEEKDRALQAVEESARSLGLWAENTHGPILEDRGSQITFSALGQAAPVEAKKLWDPDGHKKSVLREAVALLLPDLEVRSGGSTSIDITRKGIDKAFGMRKLAEMTQISLDDMLFIGDRLDEAGNDYPVKALGVTCHAVEGWQDTERIVTELVRQLRA